MSPCSDLGAPGAGRLCVSCVRHMNVRTRSGRVAVSNCLVCIACYLTALPVPVGAQGPRHGRTGAPRSRHGRSAESMCDRAGTVAMDGILDTHAKTEAGYLQWLIAGLFLRLPGWRDVNPRPLRPERGPVADLACGDAVRAGQRCGVGWSRFEFRPAEGEGRSAPLPTLFEGVAQAGRLPLSVHGPRAGWVMSSMSRPLRRPSGRPGLPPGPGIIRRWASSRRTSPPSPGRRPGRPSGAGGHRRRRLRPGPRCRTRRNGRSSRRSRPCPSRERP